MCRPAASTCAGSFVGWARERGKFAKDAALVARLGLPPLGSPAGDL
ncbi:hypothetical protein AB395_00006032 (plasmid) [Sinorhizobium fredii CCBAU 45436]|nr:hypothetical protein AB395_00006032 [Sinorhizobium fredii CCBAU 45436]